MIFKYKAYNNLLVELGRNDYVVEITELAIKDFIKRLEDSSNKEEFIKTQCEKHEVWVSYDKSNSFYNQVTLGNIANVYHLAEAFFYELQTQYNKISGTNWHFVSGTTKIKQIIDFFKSQNRFNNIDKIDAYLIDVFDYYYYLRVQFSHKKTTSEKVSKQKWQKACDSLNEELLESFKVKSKPKLKDNVDFDDFFLFTQVTKKLALRISCLCYPTVKGLSEISEIKKQKRHQDNERTISGITNYLSSEYGFEIENESDLLVERIMNEF